MPEGFDQSAYYEQNTERKGTMTKKLSDYRRLNADDRAALRDEVFTAYLNDVSIADIAVMYQCTEFQVRTFLRNHAKEQNISSLARKRVTFDEQFAAAVTSMYSKGYPIAKIAEEMHVSKMRVHSFIVHRHLHRDPIKLQQYRVQQTGYPYPDRRVPRERTMLKRYGVNNWAYIDPGKQFSPQKKYKKRKPKLYLSWVGWCMTQREYASVINAPATCVRRILPQRQVLGCYFPEQQVATEIVDTRQLGNRTPNYIPQRYTDCQRFNIQYIPVFYSEWVGSQNIVCARLDEILQTDAYKKRPVIFAKDCEIVLPMHGESPHFLRQNDLAPPIYGHYYGLKYKGELVSLIALRENELCRFVTSPKYNIPDALPTFLTVLQQEGYTYITTHTNSRWYTKQNIFTQCGFAWYEQVSPQKWYWTVNNDSLHYTKYIRNKMYPAEYFNMRKIAAIVNKVYNDIPSDASCETYMTKYGFYYLLDAGMNGYKLSLNE